MDKKKKQLIITIVLTLVLLVGGQWLYNQLKEDASSTQDTSDTANTIPAIDFNVQNGNGTNTYLSDFQDGKPIVLNFWSSQCSPCVAEMPDFQLLYEEYKDRVHFVMIDSIGALGETKTMGKTFIEEKGYTFPVYYDVNQNAQEAYSVYSFPTTYLINGDFEIVRGGSGMITYETLSAAIEEVLGE